jgi:purine-binding chemotaxis protein CheW
MIKPIDNKEPNNEAGELTERLLTSFFLSGTGFAIDIALVKELASFKALKPLSDMPDYVIGLIDLYGVTIPVVDLACRLELEAWDEEVSKGIMVVTIDAHVLGFTIDITHDIEVFSISKELTAPKLKEPFSKYIEGSISSKEGTFNLLKLDSLFDKIDKAVLFGPE